MFTVMVARWCGSLASLLFAACGALIVHATVRGLAPEGDIRYANNDGTFHCFDGARSLPASAVNDDFCDCPDGSDEPGTGACAGQDQTLFHCRNEGSTPQLLYASRVDDGVCDCCDGSDEAGLQARRPGESRCENRCQEDGARERQERQARMAKLKEGLQAKKAIVEAALADRQRWQADIARFREELPALEVAVEDAKKQAEAVAAEAAAAAAAASSTAEAGASVAELLALKEKVKAQQALIDQLQRDLKSCRAGAGASVPEAPSEEAGREAKAVVSEYAKWMEGADSTPGAIDVQDPLGAGLELGDDELAGDQEAEPASPSTADAKASQTDAVAEAEGKVKKHKDDIQQLEKKLSLVDEDRLGFASLVDQCLSKTDSQYTYKLCFFTDAKQDSTLLGRWKGWTGSREAHFSDGYMCPGGPARDLRVVFECSGDQAVLDVSEPSRCSYLARVGHPGACDDADEAALVRPPVKHPKDEL